MLTAGRVEDADYAAMSGAGKSVTGEMGTGRRPMSSRFSARLVCSSSATGGRPAGKA
jgi:hypothetical protein